MLPCEADMGLAAVASSQILLARGLPVISHLSIDQQWTALNPRWGKGHMKGEHRMLYNLIEEGETLENIIGGAFGPDLGQAKGNKTW